MSREMKHSGIEWIGDIPKEWEVRRIKSIFTERTELSENGDETLLSVSEYYGVANRKDKIEDGEFVSRAESLVGYKKCYEGDLVSNIMLAWKGSLGVTDIDGIVSPAYCVYKPSKEIFPHYYHYLFRTSLFTSIFRLFSKGIIDSRLRLYSPYFYAISTLSPPLPEQQKIADYLDKVCGEVDELVVLQEKMIEELKAYKQSVITEAVTKGLNPNAPMKDSGVDWIGEIPEHWNYIKLGLLFQFKGGYAFNSDKYVQNSNNQVIRIGNVKNNLLLLDTSPVYVDDETAGIAKNYELKPGCILFTMTGTKGKRDYFYTLLLKKSDFCKKLYLNQRVGCFIAKMDICPNYYNYLLKDNRILDQVFLYETGTANQGNLGIESISRTMLHFPPIEEQQAIASYLDSKCSEIDALIAIKQQKIEELKDYKKSVIYEYVTGKKEVV